MEPDMMAQMECGGGSLSLSPERTMLEEVSGDSSCEKFDGNDIDNTVKEMDDVETKLEVPHKGMQFNSCNELYQYYSKYAKQNGFSISIRNVKKGKDGEKKYITIACTHARKPTIKTSNPVKLRPQTRTNCKAAVNALHCPDGSWRVNSLVLDHNHEMSPSKSRFYRSHRILQPHVKKRIELHDKAGVKMNQIVNSFVIEEGGYENLPFIEKDARNFVERIRHLKLGEGDANAMQNYFIKMHVDNSNFFHSMNLDEEGRLRNVFWADARSRAAFKEFGDVITFDTTYLVNKYAMPFTLFVGVNHHGQSTLLGCGLISNENTETFTWLFKCWLTCMGDCPPNAIITDQDQAMKKAIEIVFPNARHRWCLWHIMKKVPEKLNGYKKYEAIKFSMQSAVYDSLTVEEFEKSWGIFIEKYELHKNKWLIGLYDERNRWVPAFVKNTFWAGMSTTQRSESMHAFFVGYINSKTTLKQFVEQYENALAKKVENEISEDFNSLTSYIPCISPYDMERQFQSAYTMSKFKEFQKELIGKMCCYLGACKEGDDFLEYEVGEDIAYGESIRRTTFKVYFSKVTTLAKCSCRLLEFSGILCKHQIMIFLERKIYKVHDEYILRRWSKTTKRGHAKIRICYDKSNVKPQARNYDKMCNAFSELADLSSNSQERCEEVMGCISELNRKFKEADGVFGSNVPLGTSSNNKSTSSNDGVVISRESRN